MAKRSTRRSWLRERRTGVEIMAEWAAGFPSQAEPAAKLGMTRQGLWGWLNDPDRGWDKEICPAAAQVVGCPVVALIFKHEPVGSLLRSDVAHRAQVEPPGSGAAA